MTMALSGRYGLAGQSAYRTQISPGIKGMLTTGHYAKPRRFLRAHADTQTRGAATNAKEHNHVLGLLRVLTEQVQKETIPFVRDLVQPLLDGNPPPLEDTVDPRLLADPDSGFCEVDGVALHYKDRGPKTPGAPAILLLHGWNGSVLNWEEVMDDLSQSGSFPEGCRVIAFDRPPFGLSQRPLTWRGEADANPYTAEGGARLALGLLDRLAVGSVVVAGHSAGALVAAHMALMSPERVAGLCFVAPALPSNRTEGGYTRSAGLGRQLQFAYTRTLLGMDGPGLVYVRRSIRKQAERVRGGGAAHALHPDPARQQELVEGYLKPMRAHDWDKGMLYAFRSFNFRPTSRMPYERITAPVQILLGDKEMSMLKTSTEHVVEELQARPSGSTEFIPLAECGHIPMDDQRDQFVTALRRFTESSLGTGGSPGLGSPAQKGLRREPSGLESSGEDPSRGAARGDALEGGGSDGALSGGAPGGVVAQEGFSDRGSPVPLVGSNPKPGDAPQLIRELAEKA